MEMQMFLRIESFPNGWLNKDDIILNAHFRLLKDFAECVSV